MKDIYVTLTGMSHYYGLNPFSVGKKLKCVKEPDNPFDNEAIKVVIKHIGRVAYVANTPYTKAVGTLSAGGVYDKVGKKFTVEVLFITSSKVICKVVDGRKDTKKHKDSTECKEALTEQTDEVEHDS